MAARAYKANEAEIKKFLNSEQVRQPLRDVGEKGKAIAQGLAADFRITGEYEESFYVADASVITRGAYPGPRAAVILGNDADYAAAVEWGYEGRSDAETHSAHRVLGKTLAALETAD